MSRIASPMRRGTGSRRIDMTDMVDLIKRVNKLQGWGHIGRVFAPDGGDSYWHREDGRIMVEVETMPEGQDLTCRLGSLSSGGPWMVPKPGTLVGVSCPDGQLDHCPFISAVLDNNEAPERVSPDRAIWVSDTPIEIETDDLKLGSHAATESATLGDSQKLAADAFADAVRTFATALSGNFMVTNPTGAASALVDLTAAVTLFKASQYLSGTVKVAG
jgi:hypothetical protein